MKIALYYAPATCALAPYVTLTEAGADFEVRPLDFRKRQNFTPEYLKINPKHKVPALVVNGKTIATRKVEVPADGRATVEFAPLDVNYGFNRCEVRVEGGDAFADKMGRRD